MSTTDRIRQIDETAVLVSPTGAPGKYQVVPAWRGGHVATSVLIAPADLEWLLHRARLSAVRED